MFQFPAFAPLRVLCLQHSGLPHSEICGSNCMCQSPQLIAAYHVLHRLSKPRHPPYALSNFFLTAALVFGYCFCFILYFIMLIIMYLYIINEIVYFSLFLPVCQWTLLQFENLKICKFENEFQIIYIIKLTNCLVENIGVEPMTSCVQGRRSSQLS